MLCPFLTICLLFPRQITLSLLGWALARPQFYGIPHDGLHETFLPDHRLSLDVKDHIYGPKSCGPGKALDATGACVTAVVSRDIFVYKAPILPQPPVGPPPEVPTPELKYDVVFVHAPEAPEEPEPLVVPGAKRKTLIYVLAKNGQLQQRVVQVPQQKDEDPEVYYVGYNDHDNPVLHDGLTLQDVLAYDSKDGLTAGRIAGAVDIPGVSSLGLGGIGDKALYGSTHSIYT